MQMNWRSAVLAALIGVVASAPEARAQQPLISDGLSIYYSFDSVDEDGIWTDGSGNDLHGLTVLGEYDSNEDELPDIRLDTDDKVLGAGSAWFDTLEQALDADIKEDRISICDAAADYADNCDKAFDAGLIPENGFTVAAWVKVEETTRDQGLWQHRADGGGFTHTQIQGDGNVRTTLRGDANSTNIVNINDALYEGGPVEFETWFHWAVTYQQDNPDDFGEWAVYINGEEAASGEAESTEPLGGWGLAETQGAMLGLVPDLARQFAGHMDEFYLFTRGLGGDEVMQLFSGEGGNAPGDFDGDGALTAADMDLLSGEVLAPSGDASFDLDGSGVVDNGDRSVWVETLKNTYFGDANLDGEFNSGDLVTVFTGGEYEDATPNNSGWADGDWDGNGDFNSGDFVAAFSGGGYEIGPKAAVAAVPEPSSLVLLTGLIAGLLWRRK